MSKTIAGWWLCVWTARLFSQSRAQDADDRKFLHVKSPWGIPEAKK